MSAGTTRQAASPAADNGAPDVAAALDMLLVQAALGSARRFFPGRSAQRAMCAPASRAG